MMTARRFILGRSFRKQGQYVNIGDDIRVVYVGGSGNHARLLIDAPRELNIARSTTEENPARKKETYYAEPGISKEAQAALPVHSAGRKGSHMIYLVEDDDSIRELVIYTLRSTGMDAKGFGLPSEFWHAMEEQLPELVLLDIMLPEEDGLEILRKIRGRQETKSLPVIMLTAKGTEYDQVVGLDNGADDYVAKPFGMMALVARIKAVLRRTAEKSAEGKVLQLGELRVDPVRHVVQAAGEPVNLTLKEFELLCLLLDNPGIVFTRDQLLNQIWGYSFDGESRTVDVHVRHLRQKLGDCGKYIETVRGIGYRSGDGNA